MMTDEQEAGVLDAANAALAAIGYTDPVLITDVVMVIAAVNANGSNTLVSVNTVTDEPWVRIGLLEADKLVALGHLAGMMTNFGDQESS